MGEAWRVRCGDAVHRMALWGCGLAVRIWWHLGPPPTSTPHIAHASTWCPYRMHVWPLAYIFIAHLPCCGRHAYQQLLPGQAAHVVGIHGQHAGGKEPQPRLATDALRDILLIGATTKHLADAVRRRTPQRGCSLAVPNFVHMGVWQVRAHVSNQLPTK